MTGRVFLPILISLACSGCSTFYYFPVKEELVYRHKLPIQPEDFTFESSDGTKLHGWLFRPLQGREPKAVIVQFHGNGQNLSTHFISLYEAPARDIAYVIFDYRGYGRSEGRPSPSGVVEDGIAAIRWTHQKYPDKPLIIFGQSLGGAVAIRSVSRIKHEIPIALFVADSTFPDYRTAARSMFAKAWLTYLFQPLAWAIVDNSESPRDDIAKLSPIPLLVVHGTADRVLSESLGKEVFALAKEPKEYWSISEGQHLDFMLREEGKYGERFFQKVDTLLKDIKSSKK